MLPVGSTRESYGGRCRYTCSQRSKGITDKDAQLVSSRHLVSSQIVSKPQTARFLSSRCLSFHVYFAFVDPTIVHVLATSKEMRALNRENVPSSLPVVPSSSLIGHVGPVQTVMFTGKMVYCFCFWKHSSSHNNPSLYCMFYFYR